MTGTEIDSEGYSDIAETTVVGTWKYAELQESDGTAIVRREIVTGTNTKWTDTITPLLTLQMDVYGTDSDLPVLPVTISKIALFKESSGGTAVFTTTFSSSFTISSSSSSVIAICNVEVPEVS